MTAQTLISECGTDITPFPTEKNFTSWLGICPNNRKTGGRIRSRRSRRVNNRELPRPCEWSPRLSINPTRLSAAISDA